MSRLVLCAILAALVLPFASCRQRHVRLRVSPDADQSESRKFVSAEEFCGAYQELRYEVEPPIGYAKARQQPLEPFILNAKARWNRALESLCHYFDQLCQRHNRGEITAQGYDDREDELRAALLELTDRREQLDTALEELEECARAASDAGRTEEGEEAGTEPGRARARMKEIRARMEGVLGDALRRIESLDRGERPAAR